MSVSRMTARRAYIWSHRVLGFALGVFFVALGITGTLLVYRSSVDAFFDPAPYRVSGGADTIGAQRAVAIAGAAVGQGRLTEIMLPRAHAGAGGTVYVAYFRQKHGTTLVYVDPHDGRVLAQRPITASVSRWVHDVHEALLLGQLGKNLVALLGLGLIVTTAIGVILWPGWHNLRSGFSLKRNASTWRLNYDIHKIVGITSTVFLLFFGATGIILNFKATTRAIIAAKLPRPPQVPVHDAAAPSATVSVLLASAHAAFPQSQPRSVSFPPVTTRPIAVDLIGSDDVDQIDGNKRVYLDPVTGDVLARIDSMQNRYGFTDFVYALHAGRMWANGSALAITFLLGLLPVVLLATATVVWALRKREPQHPRADELDAPAALPVDVVSTI